MFKGSITLPDAGPQEQEYEKLNDLKRWLLSILRQDSDLATLRVSANGRDITDLVGRDLTRELLKGKP